MHTVHNRYVNRAIKRAHITHSLVFGIVAIDVALEAVRPVHDVVRPAAAHRERVANDGPLRLTVEGHHLAQIVDERRQMQPIVLRKLESRSFGCLEGVHNVRQRCVRIGLVHQIVEFLQSFAHGRPEVVEFQPVMATTCRA